MKKIILINGLKRSGKNHLANILKEIFGDKSEIIAFADPIKQIAAVTLDISLNELDEYKNNPDKYGIILQNKKINFRTILQRLGSEACKSVFGDDVWTNICYNKCLSLNKDIIIIPDFRFLIEYEEGIKIFNNDQIITINIFNDDLIEDDPHDSENELQNKDFRFDFYIDNTGKPNIKNKIKGVLNRI